MRILVTGATGGVGRHVVEQLTERGVEVRALTRTPEAFPRRAGVEVWRGDLSEPDTLASALAGCDRMYLFPIPSTAADVVERARTAGVQRIVVLSSGAVTTGFDTDYHLPVERAAERSGLEWTHVRPGEFALNKLWLWGPSIREEGVVRDPNPDLAWYPTHERDIADVAVLALVEDGHVGVAYDVNGPEMLTYREQVQAIASAVGREIRFEVVTAERARELYRKQGGFAAANADFLLGFEDYSGADSDPSEVARFDAASVAALPTAEQATGRPARTFAQWARDHAADFE